MVKEKWVEGEVIGVRKTSVPMRIMMKNGYCVKITDGMDENLVSSLLGFPVRYCPFSFVWTCLNGHP